MDKRSKSGRFIKGHEPANGFRTGNIPHNKSKLIGQKFNRLTVLKDSNKRQQRGIVWECICDCGTHTFVLTKFLKNGHTKSCGCLNKEVIKDRKGDKNPSWKGDGVGYQGAHIRVGKIRGKPNECKICSSKDKETKYEWANLTGDYGNTNDYIRLCASCHAKLDNMHKNFYGGVSAWKTYGKKHGYWRYFAEEVREEEQKRIEAELKEIGEHYVKFGEAKGVEAIDMALQTLNKE